ncbi:MAG: MFS transporter [Kiritimatiellaeota bacterium]|nr:MFS transporter [Kiritimatiellota bacterium]
MSVGMNIYIPLSVVMFLQYAIWGAWAPVLATRLLGPLKMTGKQTGWIYATLPLACLFAPLVSGQFADKYFNVEWILAAAQLVGAILLFVASRTQKFGSLFIVMLLYSTCYAATLPLANAMLFAHVKDVPSQGLVFIWAPIAWALVGYFLSGWRMLRKGENDGSDCMKLAAALSLIMAGACLCVPATPPAQAGGAPMAQALGKLAQMDFLLFFVTSMFVSGMMQFYFLGSAQFMMNLGISGKAVPASMASAQVAQAVATYFLLGFCLTKIGFQWTLVIGAASWLLMYVAYVIGKPKALVLAVQPLHGLAYVLFIIVGQIFAGAVGSDAPSSMQALIFTATVGVGMFLGTQLAGIVMDKFSRDGKFLWPKIWMVPLVVMLVSTIVLAVLFKGTVPEAKPAATPPPTVTQTK